MTQPAWSFYYDSDCGMCNATVNLLRRFDRRNRIAWIPYEALDSPPRGLSWDHLRQAAYLVRPTGEAYEGFYAIRKLLTLLPPLAPLGVLLWVPGVHMIGAPSYRWIARNRYRISSCSASGPGRTGRLPADRRRRSSGGGLPQG